MNINGISAGTSQPASAGAGIAMDAESRNIQKRITDAQKQLQEISANGELSGEEKMKRRQEIQKEISDLRMQLRQHQMEVKRQEQEEKRASRESTSAGKQKEQGQGAEMSSAGMQAVISSDASLKQAKIQHSTAESLEGRANVLEAEIKQDGGGTAVEAKQAQLAGIRERASKAEALGQETLKEAGRRLREASETEQKSGAEKTDLQARKEEAAGAEPENGTRETDLRSGKMDEGENAEEKAEKNAEKMPGIYVDVRL